MKIQTRTQTITINILPHITKSKGNQIIKFGQSVNRTLEIFFIKNYAENKARRLVLDLFLFFKKTLYKVKVND